MDKQQIIDYVMNSPANTNPNVLGSMLDGIGGGVETTTVFEDDISLTYDIGQFSPPTGVYEDSFTIQVTNGFFKLVYDNNDVLLGTIKEGAIINSCDYLADYDICIDKSYDKDFRFSISGKNVSDEEKEKIQAYCQTPHHLKIEYFTI